MTRCKYEAMDCTTRNDMNACAPPRNAAMQNTDDFNIIMRSHDWELVNSQNFSTESVISKLVCSKCAAEIIMITTPKDDGRPKVSTLSIKRSTESPLEANAKILQ